MMRQLEDESIKQIPLLSSSNNSTTNGLNSLEKNCTEFDLSLQTNCNSKISFSNINYIVETKEYCCKKKELCILEDLSGIFHPGINAILGSTGSGKTTLLNILAGRKLKKHFSGSILLNNKAYPKNFKFLSGYVIQDDVVMGMLSVKENIQFSANLRLSSKISRTAKNAKIQTLLDDLGLTKCADTRVGTQLIRGISGGERKRTAIAMELISSPQILFLDEPTTGLDSSTAQFLILMLKKLSKRGIIVILSIHQPRYSIFKLFDCLFILASGKSVYHGPSKDSLKFFNHAGFICEEHDNPSDFFLDVLSGGIVSTTQTDPHLENDKPSVNLDEVLINFEEKNLANERHTIISNLYKQSKYYQDLIRKLDVSEEISDIVIKDNLPSINYQTNYCNQFFHVSGRTWRTTIRNRHALTTQVCTSILLGLIVGSIYFQIDSSTIYGLSKLQNRIGAFFFIVMNYVFGNMSVVDIFIKERAIYIHECISGYYRISVYFLAKLLLDVIPQRIFPVLFFALITYFMLGFKIGVSHLLIYLTNIGLTSIAGTSVALFLSASTNQHSIGTILTSLIWVVMMVYSGVLVNIETIPRFLQWIQYFSIFRYSINAFLINELKNSSFCDSPVFNSTKAKCTSGNEYLDMQGISYSHDFALYFNEISLLIISSFFLILTYIQLKRSVRLR